MVADIENRHRILQNLVEELKLPAWSALVEVLSQPTSVSSSGFPYLSEAAFNRILQDVPHLFQEGLLLLDWLATLQRGVESQDLMGGEDLVHVLRGIKVVENIANTAGVTAPPDLWLMRQILSVHKAVGIVDHLLVRGLIETESTIAGQKFDTKQLDLDLRFLHSRGVLDLAPGQKGYLLSGLPQVQNLYEKVQPIDLEIPDGILPLAEKSITEHLSDAEREAMEEVFAIDPPYTKRAGWVAGLYEVEIGFRILPLVLALRTKSFTAALTKGVMINSVVPRLLPSLKALLVKAGYTDHSGQVTALGARVFARGPGPFGIIRAYHSYTCRLEQMIKGEKVHSWVARGENVAASQDANRKTFQMSNDALDRFASDYGFSYDLFIEHAVGQGEATQQRYRRSGENIAHYVGADLEDAAIDKAVEAQKAGKLPSSMQFIRKVDIGRPDVLFQGLDQLGVSFKCGVMMVGNGFHEIRHQTNERMIDVFQQYCAAGLVLIFTEETGLGDRELRATGWNTYHAGFRYLHELSGQGLRPADDRDEEHFTRFSWAKCARLGGYEVLEDYSSRTRTIFPHPQPSGFNPAISVNYFCVPKGLLRQLKKSQA